MSPLMDHIKEKNHLSRVNLIYILLNTVALRCQINLRAPGEPERRQMTEENIEDINEIKRLMTDMGLEYQE